MLLISLSAIYLGQIPILQYGQRHVDQMSRMHLRYVLTREIKPWIDNFITYITDPLNNEDPEPYIKSYNAGAQKFPNKNSYKKKKKKEITTYQRKNTTNTPYTPCFLNNDSNTHNPNNPMQKYHKSSQM